MDSAGNIVNFSTRALALLMNQAYTGIYLSKAKGGGTSEALKLKLHLNSEVYKRGNFHDFG